MTELRPFQLEGVRAIYSFGGVALLADEQGLGKTVQSLFWITKIPKRRPVVIVCPAVMKWTWQAEAALHFNLHATVLEGLSPSKVPQGDIFIINYEILAKWLPFLQKLKPQCVIYDEIHYCKSLTAQRTKAAIKLSRGPASKIGLSGTPLVNRPVELWPTLKILRPDIFPSFEKFVWRYCKPRYTPWGWQYTGASNIKELNRTLRSELMIRRLKKDVMPDLPPKTRQMISYKLPSYEEYNRAQSNFLEWLRTKSLSRALKAKKSPGLTKVGYLLRLIAELKVEWTAKWVADFLENHPEEKLVAFTMHTFVIDYLKERFPLALVVDGRVTGKARTDTIRAFQSSPRRRLLLGNWKAAGVGITLTAARYFAALDLPWTPGDLFQGEDRVHRFGQKRKVTIFYLAALRTIEERLIKVLQQKAEVLDAVLNGDRDVEDFDIFEELLREMKRK